MNIGLQWFLNVAKSENIYLAGAIVDLNITKCEKLSSISCLQTWLYKIIFCTFQGSQKPLSQILSTLGVALFIVVWIIQGLQSWNR